MIQALYAADESNDLYAFTPPDGTVFICNGKVSRLDRPPLVYYYNASSTATDDGDTVLRPTAIISANPGRYLKAPNDYSQLLNKPSIPVASQAYEGTTQRLNSFPMFFTASVSSGVATFQLTTNGLSGGTAIFSNGIILDSASLSVNDATASYQMSWVFSNGNKTLTVTANKLTTANILSGILGQAQANGAVIKLQVWGY